LKKVITYGSFDLFHKGHYRLLERAKSLGDYLIVGVTTEQYDQYRGKLNIVDSLSTRMENVRSSGFADEVIVESYLGQKAEDITKYGISTFVVGSDWQGAFENLKDLCEVIYLERTKDISSTLLRSNNNSIVRIGIIGSGRIAERFMSEAKYVSGLSIESVYNPDLECAKAFGEKFELNFTTDDLSSFFHSVDAVYIAAPHHVHIQYINATLMENKHVLCEKPMSLNKRDAEKVFALAKSRNLILFEAIKTAYCPGFTQLIGVIKSGLIGDVRDVEACFTKLVPVTSTREWQAEGAGAFNELASYPLCGIAKILGVDFSDVRFVTHRNKSGVDYYTKAYFTYPDAFATVKVGIGVKSEGSMIISGTKGYISVKPPWWKTEQFDACFENPGDNESFFCKFSGDGLRYELSDFISSINGKESKKFTSRESIFMADVLERFSATKCNNN